MYNRLRNYFGKPADIKNESKETEDPTEASEDDQYRSLANYSTPNLGADGAGYPSHISVSNSKDNISFEDRDNDDKDGEEELDGDSISEFSGTSHSDLEETDDLSTLQERNETSRSNLSSFQLPSDEYSNVQPRRRRALPVQSQSPRHEQTSQSPSVLLTVSPTRSNMINPSSGLPYRSELVRREKLRYSPRSDSQDTTLRRNDSSNLTADQGNLASEYMVSSTPYHPLNIAPLKLRSPKLQPHSDKDEFQNENLMNPDVTPTRSPSKSTLSSPTPRALSPRTTRNLQKAALRSNNAPYTPTDKNHPGATPSPLRPSPSGSRPGSRTPDSAMRPGSRNSEFSFRLRSRTPSFGKRTLDSPPRSNKSASRSRIVEVSVNSSDISEIDHQFEETLNHFSQRLARDQAQLERLRFVEDQNERLKALASRQEEEIERLQRVIEGVESRGRDKGEKMSTDELERLQNELAEQETLLKGYQTENERIVAEAKKEHVKKKRIEEDAIAKEKALNTQIANLKKEIDGLQTQKTPQKLTEWKKREEEFKQRDRELMREIGELENQLVEAKDRVTVEKEMGRRHEAEMEQVLREHERLTGEIAALRKEKEIAEGAIEEREELLEVARDALEKLESIMGQKSRRGNVIFDTLRELKVLESPDSDKEERPGNKGIYSPSPQFGDVSDQNESFHSNSPDQDVRRRLNDAKQQIADLEDDNNVLGQEFDAIRSQLEARELEVLEGKEEERRLIGEMERLREMTRASEAKEEKARQEVERLVGEVERLRTQVRESENKLAISGDSGADVTELQRKLEDAEAKFMSADAKVSVLIREKLALTNDYEAQIRQLKTQLQYLKERGNIENRKEKKRGHLPSAESSRHERKRDTSLKADDSFFNGNIPRDQADESILHDMSSIAYSNSHDKRGSDIAKLKAKVERLVNETASLKNKVERDEIIRLAIGEEILQKGAFASPFSPARRDLKDKTWIQDDRKYRTRSNAEGDRSIGREPSSSTKEPRSIWTQTPGRQTNKASAPFVPSSSFRRQPPTSFFPVSAKSTKPPSDKGDLLQQVHALSSHLKNMEAQYEEREKKMGEMVKDVRREGERDFRQLKGKVESM